MDAEYMMRVVHVCLFIIEDASKRSIGSIEAGIEVREG
jgi:hypothetical protein